MKRIAVGNGLSTWYGYMGYEGSGNDDLYDAQEVTWGWGAGESFGRLWRICTAPDANTRCQAANKNLTVSGQVLDIRYSYDSVGNLAAIRDKVNSDQIQTFTYDHLNRLTAAYTDAVGVGPYNHTYSYNQLGNLTNYAGASYSYSPSHKHAVTGVGEYLAFGYDANGNPSAASGQAMISRLEGSTGYTQNFNVENELESVVVSSQTTSFKYDADLHRYLNQSMKTSVT